MPPVSRKGDRCTGHDGFLPRVSISGSNNVFCNNKPVHRKNDEWDIHCNSLSCHNGILSSGSPKVFANGIAIARVGDQIDCGSFIAEGSVNVFAG